MTGLLTIVTVLLMLAYILGMLAIGSAAVLAKPAKWAATLGATALMVLCAAGFTAVMLATGHLDLLNDMLGVCRQAIENHQPGPVTPLG